MRYRHIHCSKGMSGGEFAVAFVGIVILTMIAIAVIAGFGMFLIWGIKMIAHATGFPL